MGGGEVGLSVEVYVCFFLLFLGVEVDHWVVFLLFCFLLLWWFGVGGVYSEYYLFVGFLCEVLMCEMGGFVIFCGWGW